LQNQLDWLGLKIDKEMMLEAIFRYPDFGHAKVNKHWENEAKKNNQNRTWTKKGLKLHFGYKLHCIMERDYELIRRFKTTTSSLS
jgi:IS5 family transposase